MTKRFSAERYGSLALALAAFGACGAAPALAQSSGTWSAGISARNGRPFVPASSTNHSGYSSYALIHDHGAAVPSSVRSADRFGKVSQR
jgi:hypothetical protein